MVFRVRYASVAQSVEQLIRNQQVVCSSHITSSIFRIARCGFFFEKNDQHNPTRKQHVREKIQKSLCKKTTWQRSKNGEAETPKIIIQIVIFSGAIWVDFAKCLCYNEHRFKQIAKARGLCPETLSDGVPRKTTACWISSVGRAPDS